jgi:hypothetical protein
MFDPYWISGATANLPASAVRESRTDFGMEASRQSTHFCRAVNTTGKTPHMPLQTALAPGEHAMASPRYGAPTRSWLTATLARARPVTSTAVRA